MKLALGAVDSERLGRHPRLATLVPQAIELRNTYFDTPQGDLERARVALRIREKRRQGATDLQRLQTLKTSGRGSGGLSIRGEWEWPIAGAELDLVGLAALPPMQDVDASLLDALTPRFRTDFRRLAWQLEMHGSRIELALDIGEIIAGERRAQIRELELELQEGEVAHLWQLALELAEWLPLRPASASKAARGTALVDCRWTLPEACVSRADCLERATSALDAFYDSGAAHFAAVAHEALARLAALGDDRLSTQLHTFLAAPGDGDRLTTELGQTLVALARDLHAAQA
ncbi:MULTISPECIES: CYTH domain-containing protein [unclassified Halomonas]|uniref:CYTH domain-containing protein n=1 Tax=unclassified Halomonas TaxID=2609666 RepID=UPI0020B6B816|nr:MULTISPECIES: CYTH domain-containing protein [unclassified Halomonas]